MDKDTILQVQIATMRTQSGRDIGEGLFEAIKASVGSQARMCECANCEIVIREENFHSGCPNCGSKDFDILET